MNIIVIAGAISSILLLLFVIIFALGSLKLDRSEAKNHKAKVRREMERPDNN